MNQKLISIALFGAITCPVFAVAQTNTLDEIVVTATRMPQSLSKTIADTTVLNEQEIRKTGATDVPTLLRSLPGVEVAQSGGLGATSGIYLRGTESKQVLVLLDGTRINSATTGATALEHIMLDSIERIEVVRGNVSSLYGSEAIGGVVQLFTKRGQGASAFNASAGAGSHGTRRLGAGFSGDVNDTSFSVNVVNVKTDGVSALNPQMAPKANPNKNGYDNNSLSAQVQHALGADHSLSASLFSTRGNVSIDNAFGVRTSLYNVLGNIDKLSLALEDQFSAVWHSQVRLARGTDDSRYYTNAVQTSRYQTQNNQFVWQNNFNIAEGQQINLAVERLGQRVSSSVLFNQNVRNVNSLLGGYVGEYGAHQLQLNLRQDRYSDFGTANTGLLGYRIAFAGSWRATASVSNAFKAPTFNDMYWPLAFGYQGNPNLKPERSQNKEIGLHYAANNQRLDAVYFDNKISELIALNAAFTTVTNISQARINGQELSYSGDFGANHLKASATLQNPRNAVTGAVLARRAKEFGSVAVSHDFGVWNMGAEVRYSGARQDGVNTLHGYELLNLTARYQIDQHLNLSARVDNLFNRNYSEVYGYNTLGRTLFVGLSYQQ
ncbi:MAG: TonB-dependent receptor [Gallionella sp.]|nr:TonB-dependent receptor [Gallionella sp.]